MKKCLFILIVCLLGSGCSVKLKTTANENYSTLDENYFSGSPHNSQNSEDFQIKQSGTSTNQFWIYNDQFSVMFPNLFYPTYSWYSWNLRYVFYQPTSFYLLYPGYQPWSWNWGYSWNWYSPRFYPNYYVWGWDWTCYSRLNRGYTGWDFGLRRAGPRTSNLNSSVFLRDRIQSRTPHTFRTSRSFRTRSMPDRNLIVREKKQNQKEIQNFSNYERYTPRDRGHEPTNPRQTYTQRRTEPKITRTESVRNYPRPSYETTPKRNLNSTSTPRPYVPSSRSYTPSPVHPKISTPQSVPNSSPRPTYVPKTTYVSPSVKSTPNQINSIPRPMAPSTKIGRN